MQKLAQFLFWFGIISIPLSWIAWYIAPEIGTMAISEVADPKVRAALAEAHEERWGIYVGHWPVTLLVLSLIIDRKYGSS